MKKVRIKLKNTPQVKKYNEALKKASKMTKLQIIEKKYNVDLGVRSDMKLSTYLRKQGYNSLADMLK